MTRNETTQILAILSAAYPNSYKQMTVQQAQGTTQIWYINFKSVPAEILMIAVIRWIDTNQFPPTISEIKKEIAGLYWEAWEKLNANNLFKELTPNQISKYEQIIDVASDFRSNSAKHSLGELLFDSDIMLLVEGEAQ